MASIWEAWAGLKVFRDELLARIVELKIPDDKQEAVRAEVAKIDESWKNIHGIIYGKSE